MQRYLCSLAFEPGPCHLNLQRSADISHYTWGKKFPSHLPLSLHFINLCYPAFLLTEKSQSILWLLLRNITLPQLFPLSLQFL